MAMTLSAGSLNRVVTLSRGPITTGDSDGFFENLTPSRVFAQISPQGAAGDGRTQLAQITIRYHPQVTMDTRVVYADPDLGRDREFFVDGYQTPDEDAVFMLLSCHEVIP